jgi:hypothetical protein
MVVNGFGLGVEALYVFPLELGYHLEHVAGVPFEDWEKGSVADRAIWAERDWRQLCQNEEGNTELTGKSDGSGTNGKDWESSRP